MSLLGRRKGERGYTLTEMAAVVATAGILTAVALPVAVEQVKVGKLDRAQADMFHLTTTLISFLKDTGSFPMRRVAESARADMENRFFFTVVLSTRPRPVSAGLPPPRLPAGLLPPRLPAGLAPFPFLPEVVQPEDNVNGDFFGGVNAGRIISYEAPFFTNLAVDVLGGIGDVNGNLYDPNLWRGPYLIRRSLDPWGRSYVIFLQGVRETALDPTLDTPFMLWVLSAGPNGKLETIPREASVRGDDIGVVVTRRLS